MSRCLEKCFVFLSWICGILLLTIVSCLVGYLFFKGAGTVNLKLIFGETKPVEAIFLKKRVFDGLFPAIAGTLALDDRDKLRIGIEAQGHRGTKVETSPQKDGDSHAVKIKMEGVHFSYNHDQWILENITTQFLEKSITAIVGPSGVGKSTFLTIMNRLWESIPTARMKGKVTIKFDDKFYDIYHKSFPLSQLRRMVGIVFQVPNPFTYELMSYSWDYS